MPEKPTFDFNRRQVLGAAGVLGLAGSVEGIMPSAFAAQNRSKSMNGEEARTLSELHQAAREEGATLTVYAGGDIATQQDGTVDAFRAAFPDIAINMIVDYSKYHDVRIDRQLDKGKLIADVAHLQTLFDFPRWKRLGRLLQYRPAGYSAQYKGFVDPDGFWVTMAVYAFSYMHGPKGGPATPQELTDPKWRGQIVSSHPGDDDATLFLFKAYVDRYGWDWLDALSRQEIRFRRGTNSPGEAVDAGEALVGLAGAATGGKGSTWVTPPAGHPFLAWGQRAAIFKDAPHPAAAKLYLNWLVSKNVQSGGFNGWNVRTDVVPPGGPIWANRDANVDAFAAFMEDRAEVERWRQIMIVILGEVEGPPTPGRLGLFPTKHA